MATANTRATDSDRNDICQALDSALSEGELSIEEHRQRVSAATKATTLGELQSLASDLQIQSAPVQLPTLRSPAGRWGIWIAVAVVLVLLGAGIVWGLFGNSSSPSKTTSNPGATSNGSSPAVATPTTSPTQAPTQLLTLGGLTGLLGQMRKQFGDTMGYQLLVYPDYAVLYRPDSINAHKTVLYYYGKSSSGGWENDGNHSPPVDTTAGDLSKFDVQAVLGVLHEAPQTLHVNNATSTYLMIDSAKDGSLALRIDLSDDNHNGGYILLKGDGTITEVVT